MRKYALGSGLLVLTLMLVVLFTHFRAFGQSSNSGDPIFGTWKMDLAKSYSRRADQKPTYDTPHTRILAEEGENGVRNTMFNSPASEPAYSYSAKLDGKEYPDPRGRKDQTLTHWLLAPDLIVRLQKTNGKPSEWVIYTASPDGKIFTSMSWLPANPDRQDFQVFTRGN